MFWGLIIEPGKRYAQTVDKSFHVSMACLEINTSDNDHVPVMLDIDNQEYILCNLHKQKFVQCQLDLNFRTGDKIAFFSSGKTRVHLTGYLIEDDDDTAFDMDASDEEDEDQEVSPLKDKNKLANSIASNKRKNEPQITKPEVKKPKLNLLNKLNQAESEDDDEEEDFHASSEEESDEENSLEEDSDDDDDDSDDMAETYVVKKTPEPAKEKLNKSVDKEKKNKTPVVENQEHKKKKNKTPNEKLQSITPKTPAFGNEANGTPATQSGKKNKKKGIATPGTDTPKAAQTPGSPGSTGGSTKKTLQGGVYIEDLKLGDGQVAKSGKSVTMYYVGRLKKSNKQFDAATQGPGFKFQLGSGEVIKGWDIGVAGMRVGGKRKIFCPPHMAYGNRGCPPAIPPNSALVFEVQLRAVN